VRQRRFDVGEDLPGLTGGQSLGARFDSEAAALVWAEHWLDEVVPAIADRTPRDAAKTPQGRALLESLLRELEYGADLARRDGLTGADVGWIRQQLDMWSWQ